MSVRKRLTKTYVDAIKSDKRIEIYDSVMVGMVLRVTPTGHKSYAYRYWYNGQARQYTIGKIGDYKLAEARAKAKKLKDMVNEGTDPAAEKKKSKEPVKIYTFADLASDFSKRHLPSLRPRTRLEYQRTIDQELIPNFGTSPAGEVSRAQIISLLDSIAIERDAPTYANRVRATLSSIFSFGLDRAIVEMNPILHIKRIKGEKKRDRIYTEEEIKALWVAFEEQSEPVQSLFKILLICGQRRGETSQMRWEDIKNGVWHIPEEITKANRSHYLPLPDLAQAIINKLRLLTGDKEYVFASDRVENKPVEWIGKAKERIRVTSGVKDFRPHDLRRTAASYMAGLGIDRTVLGKVLNHKGLAGDDTVTAIYDRYDYLKEKRIALEKWSRKVQSIVSDEPVSKIFKIGSK